MIVQVVIGQAKSIEIPQSFNATVFTVSIRISPVPYKKVLSEASESPSINSHTASFMKLIPMSVHDNTVAPPTTA